ncbi:MAG TPA: LuxR C-terminal-related transcriptional regulator [Nonomuraea sp.]|nr:LuxR C-terminal-related transcriptional regulator [Nonomuraea sp.]
MVDDGHLLDPASAALLRQLIPEAQALVTVRSGEPCPDAVTALWKEELAERIVLQPFGRSDTETTLRAVLGDALHPATAGRLYELSHGNLLYLKEIITDALASGTLTRSHGHWRWDGGPRMTERLAELISARLGTLSPAETKALELLALGEPLGLAELVALTSAETVETLEERQLLQVNSDARRTTVRFSHPLYGEATRARCPTSRARRRHRELAESLEATGARRREDRLRLALWRLESGTARDPAIMLTACKLAWAAHDYPLAQRFGWAAHESGGGIEAALILANVLNYAERASEAEGVMASVWERECDERTRTLLTLTRAHTLSWGGLRRQDEADDLLATVEPTLTTAENKQEILVLRAVMATAGGGFGRAERLIEPVLAEPASPPLWAQAMLVKSWAQVYTGRCHDALTTTAEALVHRSEWQEAVPPIVGSFYAGMIDACRFAGDLDVMDAAIEESYVTTAETGSWVRGVYHDRMIRGVALRLRGQLGPAVQAMREAIESSDVRGHGTVSPAELAIAAAQTGDAALAADAFARLESSLTASSRIFTFVPDMARHWVTAASGRISHAINEAVAAAARLGELGAHAAELIVLHDAVRLGAASRVADRLAEIASWFQGPLAQVCAGHARAAADGDGRALLSTGQSFERLGLLLHAAEAYAHAFQAFDATGHKSSARAAAARAWNLATRCPGARTPALARLQAPDLTTRELEIATLAAAGLSSKQIADRLVVSVRTVDNHLSAVYTKLGITRRAELQGMIGHH